MRKLQAMVVLCGLVLAGCSEKKAEELKNEPPPPAAPTTDAAAPASAPEKVKMTPSAPVTPAVDEEEIARLMEFGVPAELAREAVTLGAEYHEGGIGTDVEVGDVIYFLSKGSAEGTAWGTDVYTHDSDIRIAGVHAGALKDGEFGIVRVEVLPGQENYEGATYNGVTTEGYGAYGLSYMIQAKPDNAAEEVAELSKKRSDFEAAQNAQRAAMTKKASELGAKPFNGMPAADALKAGDVYHFIITGSSHEGTVWGSNPYTFDSSLPLAVVHAGILKPRERGLVKVEVMDTQASYEGTTANRITSQSYGEYGPAVKLEKVELE